VFTVMGFPAVFLLLNFLSTYPWLNQNPAVYRVLTLVGGGMVLAGALVVVGQRNFGRALGYAMLIDVGASLLAVGLGTLPGVEAALGVLALRGLALTLWGIGMDQLRRAAGGDDFEAMRGLARRYPLASSAVVMGMLSLVGFPLLAGFPARWALLRLLAQIHPTAAIFLLIGMVSVALVCARGLTALLTPVETQTSFELAEPRAAWPVYGMGLVLLLALGAFPQWLLPALARAAALLTNPAP
jgi:multicomponent Na+:H+ antiporter subunit D